MAKYIIEDTSLIAVANAIRAKTGKSEELMLAQMPTEIESIEAGGGGGNESVDLGGLTQYAKTTATTTSKNSITIVNPLGGLAKKASIYCPKGSETETKLGVVQYYSIDTANGIGVMKILNASTGNATLYGSTQKSSISANSQFVVSEGEIVLRSYNTTSCIWDADCEYEVEIWQ